MMDDTTKIQVLMIYYHHWGHDEINARKISYGVNLTLKLLKERFETDEYTLKDGIRRMFYYLCNEDLTFLWSEFVEIFLQNYHGWTFEPMDTDLYDEDEMLFDRKISLEENLNLSNEDTAEIIYENGFTYQNVLSVDAIIALL